MSSKKVMYRDGPSYNSLVEYYRAHARAANLQMSMTRALQAFGSLSSEYLVLEAAFADAKARYARAAQKVGEEDVNHRERTGLTATTKIQDRKA